MKVTLAKEYLELGTYFKVNTVLTRVKERETFKVKLLKLHTLNEIPE